MKLSKLIAASILMASAAMSQSVFADAGPFYVQYPGYCNVKRVYVNNYNDIYGVEVGCSSIYGAPLMGTLLPNGDAIVSNPQDTRVCIARYSAYGVLTGGCTSGGPISYFPRSSFVVRADATTSAPSPIGFSVSTEMPDLSTKKDLPQLP